MSRLHPCAVRREITEQGWGALNEDDCFPLMLSQRECGALYMDIRTAASRAEVADILPRHHLSEDDFVAGFPQLAKWVQDLPDDIPPTG